MPGVDISRIFLSLPHIALHIQAKNSFPFLILRLNYCHWLSPLQFAVFTLLHTSIWVGGPPFAMWFTILMLSLLHTINKNQNRPRVCLHNKTRRSNLMKITNTQKSGDTVPVYAIWPHSLVLYVFQEYSRYSNNLFTIYHKASLHSRKELFSFCHSLSCWHN